MWNKTKIRDHLSKIDLYSALKNRFSLIMLTFIHIITNQQLLKE